MHKRRSKNTRGIYIQDEKIQGYVVNGRNKVVGEARSFDPYSHYGEIMLYEIDSFGFVHGFLHKNWSVMSEEDLIQNKKLRKSLAVAQYEIWKRHNISELLMEYKTHEKKINDFDLFCKKIYDNLKKSDLK